MADGITLDAPSFFSKVQKLHLKWQKEPEKFDCILAVQGKVKDEDTDRQETSEFIMWLLHWEFSDTIILMLRNKIIFGVSPKKASLLTAMNVPEDYSGPSLKIISRNLKHEDVATFVRRILEEIPSDVRKIANFKKDKIDGELSQKVFDGLLERQIVQEELGDFFQEVQKVKLEGECKNMQMAANFTEWTFKRIVTEIEQIIEEDKRVKHSTIQNKIESGLDQDAVMGQFLDKYRGVEVSFLEYSLPIQIQSGNSLQVNKFEVDSSQEKLNSKAVYINVCGKFCDMSAMASRTLLVDPTEDQKQAYMTANEALSNLIEGLQVGARIKDVYSATKNFIMQKNADLIVQPNFGFGIGFNYKERVLAITAQNDTIIEPGMTFHVRITLSGISKEEARNTVAIGDTITVASNSPSQVLTAGIQKAYTEISYSLEESDADQEAAAKDKKPVSVAKTESTRKTTKKQEGSSNGEASFAAEDDESNDEGSEEILKAGQKMEFHSSRLRSKADDQLKKQNEIEDRKTNQMRLQETKQRDLRLRFDRGEISNTKAKKKVKKMDLLQAYRSTKDYPQNLAPGKIFVDMKHHAVLIPNSPTTWIPVHIGTIKSVSDAIQGQWTFLRINFHTSGGNTMQFPPMEDPNNLWMKALTIKTQAVVENNRLCQASKQIKECMKQLKNFEQDRDNKAALTQDQIEPLVMMKGSRREVLDNLVIRPNLVGRKTIGNLEIHQNGVRFLSSKGQKVDIVFSNVKHLFYQPCASDELIVILHFNLKTPILIGEKPTSDIQFYKESGIAAEDINFKGRRNMNDMDELEQEQAERQQRARLNKRFLGFAKLIEEAAEWNKTKLEVDIPEDDLSFSGCPQKQVVKIRPTKNCLVALSEFPTFVLDVSEIEVVHFERMFYGMKNFDLAIIKKDFTTVLHINSIPTEFVEELKSYFNEIGIIYCEGMAPLKWDMILSTIRDDFKNWLDDGCWLQFAKDDEEDDEEESEDEGDPACSYGEEEEESSESDYSGSNEESSDVASDEGLSEPGESWDELDKRAQEEDRKQNTRVVTKPNGPPNNKSRPQTNGRRR